MAGNAEVKVKELLKSVLDKYIPSSYYAIQEINWDSIHEDKVCLEKDGTKWQVYTFSRNVKEDMVIFGNLVEACLHVIESVSSSKRELDTMKDEFLNELIVDLDKSDLDKSDLDKTA